MSVLRVEAHLRGHVAPCNGRVELVGARVEPHSPGDARSHLASEQQAREEDIRREKARILQAFQREVRERVQRKERAKYQQQQLSEPLGQFNRREGHKAKRVTSQQHRTEGWKEGGAHHEPVAVVVVGTKSVAHRARHKLLAASRSSPQSSPYVATPPPPPAHAPPSSQPATPGGVKGRERRVRTHHSGRRDRPTTAQRPTAAEQQLLSPARRALAQRKGQAHQCRMFHRLYSDLERARTRQRRSQRALQLQVEREREERELHRRAVEEELGAEEGSLYSASSAEEAREKVREWEETLVLERRRHQLQSAREMERYVEALRAQVREKLSGRETPVPSLCLCSPNPLDTDPHSCANNCPFYHNPRAYAKALTNLLGTLKL